MFLPFLVVIIISWLYISLITSYYWAWKRLPFFIPFDNNCKLKVSIIIAARNEEKNIELLLSNLKTQDYDSSLFEVIIINDHSTDETLAITEKFQNHFLNLNILDLPKEIEGKKKALLRGIEEAKGELIITLDADCSVGKYWLRTIASFYANNNFKLIVCPLLYSNENNLFGKLQALEIVSLVASGAGAVALDRPIFCNGANLAFSKQVYIEVNKQVKPELASGDDVFLLLAVKKKWPGSVGFLKSIDAAAYTSPEPDLMSFFSQRKRWASKGRFYNDFDILYAATVVFLCNLSILLALVFSFFNSKFILLFFSLLCLKSLPDYMLIRSFSKYFNKSYLLKYFAITQLAYPFYLVIVAVWGSFGKYTWKNRVCK